MKVYCKKDYFSSSYDGKKPIFKNGHSYGTYNDKIPVKNNDFIHVHMDKECCGRFLHHFQKKEFFKYFDLVNERRKRIISEI